MTGRRRTTLRRAAAMVVALTFGASLSAACGLPGTGGHRGAQGATSRTPEADGTPVLVDPKTPEADASADIPGTFVPSQGRAHFTYRYSPSRRPVPFCAGVAHSPDSAPVRTDPRQSVSLSLDSNGAPFTCYASNPPSSGTHFNVEAHVDLGNGASINIPPDPDVYPPDIEIPRGAIPHWLEHAGVFIGWNCAAGDDACARAVTALTRVAHDRLDNNHDRIVMAHDADLPAGDIGLSSWTRVDLFSYREYKDDRVVQFVEGNSCRYDPERLCK